MLLLSVFLLFWDIDFKQFYVIFVILGSFWSHFGVLGRPGAQKGPMVEEKRNQSDFGRHNDGIPP